MTRKSIRLALLATGLLGLGAGADAQVLNRDLDNETRNAYQQSCSATQIRPTSATCALAPLEPGKRITVRYITATCAELSGSSRNLILTMTAQIAGAPLRQIVPFVPRRVNTSERAVYLLAEPVYVHSDSPLNMQASWDGDANLACTMSAYGSVLLVTR